MTVEVPALELSLATVKAAATAAAKKWFYESFDDDLMEKMEKAGLIAQAEGFSISVIATLQLDIEQAFDAAISTINAAEPLQPSGSTPIPICAGADDWANALLKLEVVKEALTGRNSTERLKNMDAGLLLCEGISILHSLRYQEQQSEPSALRFPTSLRKMWSGGEVQQWLEDQGPLYRTRKTPSDDQATLQRVYDAFGIGELARTPSTLFTCIGNTQHFAQLLEEIEREFLMVPGVPSEEPEDLGSDPEDECLVIRWGSSKEQYVEQFRRALLTISTPVTVAAPLPMTMAEPATQN